MDVIERLRRFAFLHPHVFVVEGPGGTEGRLAVERWAQHHGWPLASEPPDADLLVLCGTFTGIPAQGVGRLQATLARPAASVWLPPRTAGTDAAEVDDDVHADVVVEAGDVAGGLRRAAARLVRDLEPQRPPVSDDAVQDEAGGGEDEAGGGEHEADHGDHDHDEHEHDDHDHDDMEVGGLPLASRARDRDGLALDVLHVPLGPALAAWPPGLVLRLSLQGDVVQEVDVDARHLASHRAAPSWWNRPWLDALAGEDVPVAVAERRRAAAHLDSLARLTRVAGDEGATLTAWRLRAAALDGAAGGEAALADAVARLARRLRRARLLDRVTRGVGRLSLDEALELGLGGPALRACGRAEDARTGTYPDFAPLVALGEGDARSRWHQWLAEAEQALRLAAMGGSTRRAADGRVEGPRGPLARAAAAPPPSRALIAAICHTLAGQELAVARLIVASFDPDVADLGGGERA